MDVFLNWTKNTPIDTSDYFYCYRILGCGSLWLWAGAAAFNVGVVLDTSAGIITAVRLGYKQALKGLVEN